MPYFHLQTAELVGHLLHLASVSLGQTTVHLADVLIYGLCNGSGSLTLCARADHLLLSIRQRNAHTRHSAGVAHQCLAHHVGNRHSVLARSVQTLLLSYQVIHGRKQRLQCLLVACKGRHLLQARTLHGTADNAKRRLGAHKLVDARHVALRRLHALLHDGLQLRLDNDSVIRLVDEGLHGSAKPLDRVHGITAQRGDVGERVHAFLETVGLALRGRQRSLQLLNAARHLHNSVLAFYIEQHTHSYIIACHNFSIYKLFLKNQ